MTDLDNLKQTLQAIKCNFTSCNTLIGTTVTVATETKTLDFEFDTDGKYLRII